MIDLYEEFRGLISLLQEAEIDYAVCGGLAMAIHSRPRATVDIDLLIRPESLEKVISIASSAGYSIRGRDLSFAKGAIEIRRVSKIDSESGDLLSLDMLLVTPEILPIWESRVSAVWEHGRMSVVSRDGLIKLKELRSSGQDLDDISVLRKDETNAG